MSSQLFTNELGNVLARSPFFDGNAEHHLVVAKKPANAEQDAQKKWELCLWENTTSWIVVIAENFNSEPTDQEVLAFLNQLIEQAFND